MCLTINYKTEDILMTEDILRNPLKYFVQVSKKDIAVYKWFDIGLNKQGKQCLITPFQNQEVAIDGEIMTVENFTYQQTEQTLRIYHGIHAYNEGEECYKMTSSGYSYANLKCIIPAGTPFIRNEHYTVALQMIIPPLDDKIKRNEIEYFTPTIPCV